MTTTLVVPSPATTSWLRDRSTSILAAGCSSVILLRMVAPSLVMTTSPLADATILSIPRGPRLVRTASATALAASMFTSRTSFFLALSLRAPPVAAEPVLHLPPHRAAPPAPRPPHPPPHL